MSKKKLERKIVSVTMLPELYEELLEHCKNIDVPVSVWCRDVIKRELHKWSDPPKNSASKNGSAPWISKPLTANASGWSKNQSSWIALDSPNSPPTLPIAGRCATVDPYITNTHVFSSRTCTWGARSSWENHTSRSAGITCVPGMAHVCTWQRQSFQIAI